MSEDMRDVPFKDMTLDEVFELEDAHSATLGNAGKVWQRLPEDDARDEGKQEVDTSALVELLRTSNMLLFDDFEAAFVSGFHEAFSEPQSIWAIALSANPFLKSASSELFPQYWMPIYAFIRSCEYDRTQAEEATLRFVYHFLPSQYVTANHPPERVRVYLLSALRSYLNEHFPGHTFSPISTGLVCAHSFEQVAESLLRISGPAESKSGIYERAWTLNLLKRVHLRLESECSSGGDRDMFHALVRLATLEWNPKQRYLNLESQGIRRQPFEKMRRRYLEAFEQEVALTVDRPQAIPDEIQYLLEVLRKQLALY